MSKVIFKAKAMQFKNGCLLVPATPADKRVLDSFCQTSTNHIVTVTANYARANKTYDQVKTIFALINILFESQKDRKPTQNEQALVYSRLLWDYADRVDDPISGKSIPVSLSDMDVGQAAHFINSIMGEIFENSNGLTDVQQIDLRQIFEEFQSANGFGKGNPIDYDKEGNMLSVEEWRKQNAFSFASYVKEGLELHHILTRGSHPQYAECTWNFLMLTSYEHNQIIHSKQGWKVFLEMFPHLAPRVLQAYKNANELMPHEIQVAMIKLGLIDEYTSEETEEYSIPEEEGLF